MESRCHILTLAAWSRSLYGVVLMTHTAPATNTATISVDSLWKIFGSGDLQKAQKLSESGQTRAEILEATGQTVGVRDVSFSVDAGETFVVMGLSGSGKSTLIRCLSRLVEPSSGSVHIDGRDLTSLNAKDLRDLRRTTMSMVFQHFGLLPHRRVIDNVAYGLEVQGISKVERHARAIEVIETVGLAGWADHYPQQLSGGMQQRVGLARALAVDPKILFFDEPFSALDPLIRRDMQTELCNLQMSAPRTIVFITHDFAEAIRLGDRIAIMKDGVFEQIGTPEEIVLHPATDYVREFTNDIPKVNVITVGSLMRHGPVAGAAPTVGVADTAATALRLLLGDDATANVIDASGAAVGHVTRSDVAKIFASDS